MMMMMMQTKIFFGTALVLVFCLVHRFLHKKKGIAKKVNCNAGPR